MHGMVLGSLLQPTLAWLTAARQTKALAAVANQASTQTPAATTLQQPTKERE